eukprot:5961398-Prymnesium_polylepis.2
MHERAESVGCSHTVALPLGSSKHGFIFRSGAQARVLYERSMQTPGALTQQCDHEEPGDSMLRSHFRLGPWARAPAVLTSRWWRGRSQPGSRWMQCQHTGVAGRSGTRRVR